MTPLAVIPEVSRLPESMQSALVMGLVIGGLFTLASFILVGLQIWELLRPKTDLFVTRTEFEQLRADISINRQASERHFAEIATKVDGTQKSMSNLATDIMRAIGKLEGKLEANE